MEYEPDRQCKTMIGFSDPRKDVGELLFPARFSKEAVEREKRTLGSYAAAGQLQQRPAPREGGMFKIEHFKIINRPESEREATMRYWDKAGTDGAGAYTAGVKMSRMTDGSYLVEHVERGQWSANKRENRIRETAEHDGKDVHIWMEQEPGSSGKDVAQLSIRNLAGFTARADRVSGKGSKEIRAEPYSAQVEAGNVYLLKADWNDEFIREHALFPNGTYKDQVDAAAGCFSKLVKNNKKPQLALGGGKAEAIRL
jgi:predicted phage terminase large subunit-like protein